MSPSNWQGRRKYQQPTVSPLRNEGIIWTKTKCWSVSHLDMTTFVKTVGSDAVGIQTLLATSHSSHWSSTLFVVFYLKAFWFYFQSCNYKRIVGLLLRAALVHHDDFIQRTAIALCNLLVCQVCSARNLTLWYVQTWEQWGPSGENACLAPRWRGLKSWCQQGWIEFVIILPSSLLSEVFLQFFPLL